MRKLSFVFCLLALCLTAVQKVPAQASGEMAKGTETAKPAALPAHFYRLDIVLEQVDVDGKPTNSRSYTTTISTLRGDPSTNPDSGAIHSDSHAEIRTGVRVPIVVGAGKDAESSNWQYVDVGVSIDARNVREVAGKLTLFLLAEISSVADTKEGNSHPVIEQNKWQGQVLIPVGKATTVFSSDDIHSQGGMRMLVTATLLQ